MFGYTTIKIENNLSWENNWVYITHLCCTPKSEGELQCFLKVKEESEKAGLKLKKLGSWHSVPSLHGKYGGKVKTVTDFIFLGSKITVDGDCSHKIKRCFLLGRKAMTNLDSIFKSRDITLPTKVRLVKAVVFPEVMYGCETWSIKKAEHLRIDAFELWCCRRVLKVPWTARRSLLSILKEIILEYSLEGLLLKLEPILWPPDVNWLVWKDLDAEKNLR